MTVIYNDTLKFATQCVFSTCVSLRICVVSKMRRWLVPVFGYESQCVDNNLRGTSRYAATWRKNESTKRRKKGNGEKKKMGEREKHRESGNRYFAWTVNTIFTRVLLFIFTSSSRQSGEHLIPKRCLRGRIEDLNSFCPRTKRVCLIIITCHSDDEKLPIIFRTDAILQKKNL